VLAPSLAGAIPAAWAIAEQISDMRKPLDIQITATEAGLDVDVRGSGPLSAMQVGRLAGDAQRHGLARITGPGGIAAPRAAHGAMGRANVALPPGAFLQATSAGDIALAHLVETHCAGAVWRRICSAASDRLRCDLQTQRVRAVDGDAAAIGLATSRQVDAGLKPIEAQVRDLFRQPLPGRAQGIRYRVIRSAATSAPRRRRALATSAVAIVAVSCNPVSFARDARILVDGGYRLAQVTPSTSFSVRPRGGGGALSEDRRRRTEDG
jgi:23S rRNA (uracil1939-C5)-methyltransferase